MAQWECREENRSYVLKKDNDTKLNLDRLPESGYWSARLDVCGEFIYKIIQPSPGETLDSIKERAVQIMYEHLAWNKNRWTVMLNIFNDLTGKESELHGMGTQGI